jgi:hypothetical protein
MRKLFDHYFPKFSRIFNSFIRLGAIEQCRLSVDALRHREEVAALPKYDDPLRLARSEHKVYSQHGEDGVLAEIFRRIGVTDRRFVEIGVTPLENNTLCRFVQGWTGVWIDGGLDIEKFPERLRQACEKGELTALTRMLTRENVGGILREAGMRAEFDLLSLDVDMNTYELWAGLAEFRPRVIVVEYNGYFPPDIDWRVDYRPDAKWDGTTYFGASLKAFERLGRERGYRLVGCDLSGTNAFFVREDAAVGHFLASGDAATHYEPPRYHFYVEALGCRPGFGAFVIED